MKRDKEKELDNLFREGVENPAREANFREDDWDAMEAMLDKDKKRRGIVFWLPVLGSIAAMLLLTMAWFLVKHKDQPALVKAPTVKPAAHGTHNGTITGPSTTQQTIATVKPHTGDTNGGGADAQDINSTLPKHNVATRKNGAASAQYVAAVQQVKHRREGQNVLPKQAVVGIDKPVVNNAVVNSMEVLAANNAALDMPDVTAATSAEALMPKLNKPKILPANTVKDKSAIKRLNPNRPQFAITVLASPDINSVSTFSNSMVGTNAGLMFSMGLGKKFTISTGAVYSKKPYMTDFDNYHHNYNFKIDPDNVTADCRVLDIPINVDYTFYNRSKNKFSVGSGLSSYIMLRENYHYNYSTAYPGGPTDYDIANKNQHFLGVLNLDATYSRKVNSRFSLGIEPYLKIPLTNIGYSQVKLQSTGLAVGVTWNINSPPK